MSNQTSLFSAPKIDWDSLDKLMKSDDSVNHTLAYTILRGLEIPTNVILNRFIKNRFKPFDESWEEFENTGKQVHFEFSINNVKFFAIEEYGGGDVIINIGNFRNVLFELTESDIYDSNFKNKITNRSSDFFRKNMYQIEKTLTD